MLHPALTENRLLFNIGHLEENIFRSNGGSVMPGPGVITNIRFQRQATSLAHDVTASNRYAIIPETLPTHYPAYSFNSPPLQLREAQLRERRARRSAADIRNDVKFERGHSGEIYGIILALASRAGRAEIVLLADDLTANQYRCPHRRHNSRFQQRFKYYSVVCGTDHERSDRAEQCCRRCRGDQDNRRRGRCANAAVARACRKDGDKV
jgi:hypothetical protein